LNETIIEGTEGTLRLATDGSFWRVGLDGTAERRPVKLLPDDQIYVDGYAATQAHFVEGTLHGTPHATDGPDTLRTMDVVWGAYRSAAEKRVVVLEPPR
jgi:predicted dehydrogenase